MNNLPGRSNDAGPESRPDCPICKSRKWHSLGYCHRCADTCCSDCAVDTAKGMMCAMCLANMVVTTPEDEWPELATLEEVQAIVRVAQIPEWLEPVNGWVN